MTTMPAQPGGQRYDRGDTATLTAGANPAAVPARYSHNSLALGISTATDRAQSNARGKRSNPRITTLLKQSRHHI